MVYIREQKEREREEREKEREGHKETEREAYRDKERRAVGRDRSGGGQERRIEGMRYCGIQLWANGNRGITGSSVDGAGNEHQVSMAVLHVRARY